MSNITLTSKIENDLYTDYLYNQYDIQNRETTITTVPMIDTNELNSFEWNIGIILGNSGSGKSTLLRSLNQDGKINIWDENKPLISQFPNKTPEDVCELYFGIGLCSIPTLLRKPHELSNGEFDRFSLAFLIGNCNDGETIYVDEFTSVVNRDVAKSMSFALQRYIRKHNLKIVLASCHFDIIEWLQPDWIFNLNKQSKNGEATLEKMVYSDDTNYNIYNNVDTNDILSDARNI